MKFNQKIPRGLPRGFKEINYSNELFGKVFLNTPEILIWF